MMKKPGYQSEEPVEMATIYYSKSVYSKGFGGGSAEDDCKKHLWKHRNSKYFRNPLPKNWVYCPRCGTEKLETL